jgi:hypothetical protein
MGRKNTIITILITVIVIAVLIAAGFAIYRLGYVRGLAASVGEPMGGRFFWFFDGDIPDEFGHRFPENFEDRFPEGFRGRMPFYFRQGGLPYDRGFQPTTVFPWARGTTGVVLFVGVVALVVIAVSSVIRLSRSPSQDLISSTAVDQEAAPESEET